jgi:HEAT repeat protein
MAVGFLGRRQSPESVKDALEWIRRGDDQTQLLIDALGDARTAEAQSGLVGLLGSSSKDIRRGAMTALSLLNSPTAATVDALTKLVRDPEQGRQARLALGAAAYRLQTSAPEQARAVVDGLLSGLRGASTAQEADSWLRALGNAGNKAAIPVVEPYLNSTQETLRLAGVRALRRVSDPNADTLLAARITQDPSREAREGALNVALARQPSAPVITAVLAAVRKDSSVNARYAAVLVAARWAPSTPILASALEQASNSDSNKNVRDTAKAALERMRKSG